MFQDRIETGPDWERPVFVSAAIFKFNRLENSHFTIFSYVELQFYRFLTMRDHSFLENINIGKNRFSNKITLIQSQLVLTSGILLIENDNKI